MIRKNLHRRRMVQASAVALILGVSPVLADEATFPSGITGGAEVSLL